MNAEAAAIRNLGMDGMGVENREQAIEQLCQSGYTEEAAAREVDGEIEFWVGKLIRQGWVDISPTFDARLDLSEIYLKGSCGDPAYEGFDDLDAFVYEGVEAEGFWSRAWARAFGDKERAEENFQEIVLAAVEVVEEHPEITEESPGYLLQRAAWRARNTYNKRNHTYLKRAHEYVEYSLDYSDDPDQKPSTISHETIEAPSVDWDMILSVRRLVDRLDDDRLYRVATLLMEGYTKTRIAEMLGVTPAAVSYYVKKLRAELSDLFV
jgi:DNA-directed RNA polymerase specialized sigma24 family protein